MVVINIVDKLRFEVLKRIKFLQVEQFTLEMSKEILHNRVVVAVALSAHALFDPFFFQHLSVLLVLVMPPLV